MSVRDTITPSSSPSKDQLSTTPAIIIIVSLSLTICCCLYVVVRHIIRRRCERQAANSGDLEGHGNGHAANPVLGNPPSPDDFLPAYEDSHLYPLVVVRPERVYISPLARIPEVQEDGA